MTCAGKTIEVAPQDLTALRRGDLIETAGPVQISSGSYTFHLTHNATALALSPCAPRADDPASAGLRQPR